MKKSYVDLPQGQVHYLSEGQGEPLLLLHQSPLSAVEWSLVVPLLSPYYRVIVPDMPGHGQSDDPAGEVDMGLLTRSTLAFMDALGLDRVIACGNHSGAALATSLAIAQPQRVSRLAVSCDMLMTPQQAAGFLDKLRSRPMSRALPMTADGDFLVQTWARYGALCAQAPLALRFKAFAVGLAARQRPFDAHEAVLQWRTEADQLALASCPTLVFAAEHDLFFTPQELEQALQRLPGCQTVVIPQAGALSPLEAPQALASALLGFLQAAQA